MYQIPKWHIPAGKLKRFTPGLDLPAKFLNDLQGIDQDLHIVWHEYETLWDTIINTYTGELDNPRFTVNGDYGTVNFGYVVKNRDNSPKQDLHWHVWRWCYPHGLAHIVKIESDDGDYLDLLLNRLAIQKWWTDKYGAKSYNRVLQQGTENEQAAAQRHLDDMNQLAQKENKWLLKSAMDNMSSGKTAPTNPTKEIITSYAGQGNRTKIIRPITDSEAGIVNPFDR